MIDIDPRWYLPPSYLLRWRCPHCAAHVPVPNGALRHAHCPACAQPLATAQQPAAARPADDRLSA